MNLSGKLSKQNQDLRGKLSQTTNHNGLNGRDNPNQHPIEAISGLQEYIDALNNGFVLYCGTATEVI